MLSMFLQLAQHNGGRLVQGEGKAEFKLTQANWRKVTHRMKESGPSLLLKSEGRSFPIHLPFIRDMVL